MTQETLKMSDKERDRLVVMREVQAGILSLAEGAELMNVTYRHARRLLARYESAGDMGLVHASRGRVSNRRLAPAFQEEVLRVYREHLMGYGPTLASEVLAEDFDVKVCAETLRRWLHAACLFVPRTLARRHRRRRARRDSFGEMVQLDGSFHNWFAGRGPDCNLMVAVDDATGRTHCHFSEQETLESAYEMVRQWNDLCGIPNALYVDRRNIYVASREPVDWEKRLGTGAQTDFGHACRALGIRLILANSPEAKGRVERMNGVLQDRLVKALTRRGISTISAANAYLPAFLADFNARFAREPASRVDRHGRSVEASVLNEVLCRQFERTVQRDWTVMVGKRIYQIQSRDCLPRQRVMVRQHLDASISIVRDSARLSFQVVSR